MEKPKKSIFVAAALKSDLVSQEQLDEIKSSLKAEDLALTISSDVSIPDEMIAEKLLDQKILNAWQIEQLKQGRTKFNLGEYQIVDSIGEGGMGQVFMAIHTLLDRVEAIKVLPLTKSTEESIINFRREIRAQAQLDHPNLVRVNYAGSDGKVYYLVTEYISGMDLRQYVRSSGQLSMKQAADIICQAACGLQHAHDSGLIHRDVKPGNILVSDEGITKVSDLGLAGYLFEGENDPRAGKIVGTSDYLAPDQVYDPNNIKPVSDIYSLGCTLYYAVTGKVPFPGGTTKEKVRRHCKETPLHPRSLNSNLSVQFVELLAAMMDKDPEKRVQTATEVQQRLRFWLDHPQIDLTTEDHRTAVEIETQADESTATVLLDGPDEVPVAAIEEMDSTNSDILREEIIETGEIISPHSPLDPPPLPPIIHEDKVSATSVVQQQVTNQLEATPPIIDQESIGTPFPLPGLGNQTSSLPPILQIEIDPNHHHQPEIEQEPAQETPTEPDNSAWTVTDPLPDAVYENSFPQSESASPSGVAGKISKAVSKVSSGVKNTASKVKQKIPRPQVSRFTVNLILFATVFLAVVIALLIYLM